MKIRKVFVKNINGMWSWYAHMFEKENSFFAFCTINSDLCLPTKEEASQNLDSVLKKLGLDKAELI